MKKSIFIAIILFATSFSTEAQTNDFKWRFGVNAGMSSYIGDLNTDISENHEGIGGFFDLLEDNEEVFEDYSRHFIGLELERRLTQRIGFRLNANYGQIAFTDRYRGNNQFDRSLNFQTDIFDANAAFKLSLFKRKSFINFYLVGGAGITMFDVYADLLDENELYYDYSSNNIELDGDFETNVSDLNLQKDQKQLVLHIPAGIGVQLKVLPRITASLEFENRFTFTDYLDNVSDAGAGRDLSNDPIAQVAYNPNDNYVSASRGNVDNVLFDSYNVLRVGLSYNFCKSKAAKAAQAKVKKAKTRSLKNIKAPKFKKGKFRAPNFFPSKTPSALHTENDALIDGGKSLEVEASEEMEGKVVVTEDGTEVIVNEEGEIISEVTEVEVAEAQVSEETMLVIDEALAIVDETIAVVDQTIAEQAAIEEEIAILENQILDLETSLTSENEASDEEKAELVAEIERLEADVDAALNEQAAYIAEMEAAQEEAIQMLEIANAQIEAAKASEDATLQAKAEEMEAAIEALELEKVEEKEAEKAEKKEKKKRNKKNKKKNKKEAKAEEEIIEVEMIVEDTEDNKKDVQVWVDDEGNEFEKEVQVFIDDNGTTKTIEKEVIITKEFDGKGKGGNGAMRQQMFEMQQEIDRLRAEKQEMQMNQIQNELDDIKNTLNLLLQDRINGNSTPTSCTIKCDTKCDKSSCDPSSKDCCKSGNSESADGKEMRVEKKVMIIEGTDDIEKLMEENPELKDVLEGIDIEKMIDEEKKNDGLKQNEQKTQIIVPENQSNSTSGATNGTTSSSSKSTTTSTNNTESKTTTQPTNTTTNSTTQSTTTTNTATNFPKNSTGRTKYDYTQMEEIKTFDFTSFTKVNSYSSNNPKIIGLLRNVADEVNRVNGVVLIRANTTEVEKNKMRNVIFDINKDLVYSYNLEPYQIDSSIHIAADNVQNIREIYINGNKLELVIFR